MEGLLRIVFQKVTKNIVKFILNGLPIQPEPDLLILNQPFSHERLELRPSIMPSILTQYDIINDSQLSLKHFLFAFIDTTKQRLLRIINKR